MVCGTCAKTICPKIIVDNVSKKTNCLYLVLISVLLICINLLFDTNKLYGHNIFFLQKKFIPIG